MDPDTRLSLINRDKVKMSSSSYTFLWWMNNPLFPPVSNSEYFQDKEEKRDGDGVKDWRKKEEGPQSTGGGLGEGPVFPETADVCKWVGCSKEFSPYGPDFLRDWLKDFYWEGERGRSFKERVESLEEPLERMRTVD